MCKIELYFIDALSFSFDVPERLSWEYEIKNHALRRDYYNNIDNGMSEEEAFDIAVEESYQVKYDIYGKLTVAERLEHLGE